MKTFRKIAAAFTAAAIAIISTAVPVTAKTLTSLNTKTIELSGDYAAGEVLVTLRKSAGSEYLSKSNAKSLYGEGITIRDSYTLSSGSKDNNGLRVVLLKSKTLSTAQLMSKLRGNSAVRNVSPNYRKRIRSFTDDSYSSFQWALKNEGQNGGTAGADTKSEKLRALETKSKDEQVVAIIDSGIDLKHEDLVDNLWNNPLSKKQLLGKHGLDFTGENEDMSPMDTNGHGTHVAGIIAATADNKKGISGISPANTKIMALKCLDEEGYGYDNDFFAAFEYIYRAKKLGVNITAINCSWGGIGDENEVKTYDSALNKLGELGIITCVSAGNTSTDLDYVDSFGYKEYYVPSSCTSPFCITVAASDTNGNLADFTDYGKESVDVAAPGDSILSAVSYDCFNPSLYSTEQEEKLCSDIQDYNGSIKEGDFGYPEVVGKLEGYANFTDKVKVSQGEGFFGISGKSLNISYEGNPKKNKLAVLTVPFELEDENQEYRYSMMIKSLDGEAGFLAIDVPADMEIEEALSTVYELNTVSNSWSHFEIISNNSESDTYNEYDEDEYETEYEKSKQRKLVIILLGKKSYQIDDLAISKQGVSEDEFGKYDFYSGTSMASPFVAGAVALLRNKHPELGTVETINTIVNTGAKNESLSGKVKSGRTLSLENIENLPPIISSIDYNKDGNVEIKGSFKNLTEVKVNGKTVTPLKKDDGTVVIPDSSYSSKSSTFSLSNEFGDDEKTLTITKQKLFETTKLVKGETYYANYGDFIPAGNRAFFVNKSNNTIDEITENGKNYRYNEDKYSLNFKKIYGKKNAVDIISSDYANNAIYMLTLNSVNGERSSRTLAYETKLCKYNLKSKTLTALCDLPEDITDGASLVYFNKNLYIVGGYDKFNTKYLDTVYKYNSKKAVFTPMSEKLPRGRAYGRYIVCGGKIVGVYGAQEDGKLPGIITFDGKKWTESSVVLDSSDYVQTRTEKLPKIYPGSLGYAKNGVFCNGSYMDGFGTAFVYNVKKDKAEFFPYTSTVKKSDTRVYGTTLPNCFIGFSAIDNAYDYDDDDEYYDKYKLTKTDDTDYKLFDDDYDDDDYYEKTQTYLVKLTNNQAVTEIKLNKTSITMKVGKTATVKPTVTHPKGKTTFKSSKKNVVRVSAKGKLKALKAGKAVITVTNNKVKATLKVTVKKAKKKTK